MIQIGDIVTVQWERISGLYGVKVLHMPMSEGESWVFSDEAGNVYDVRNYCLIKKER